MGRAQHGFTLIELMIVVAIIGILAAIAVGGYIDYTGRAQVADTLTVTDGLRKSMTEYYANNGSFKDLPAESAITSKANQLTGNYFGTNSVTVDASGVMEVSIDSGVHEGDTFKMSPKISDGRLIGWRCGGLDPQYLPSSCQ
ncbi:pilin [Arhodomonas aquaeolei]|uniref:pilin n=1 Tax=Arhodomonas aquaeolei TaxID=2369 RepID=UPI00286E8063|nr:pilin [Arhodomonas aquaeolei]